VILNGSGGNGSNYNVGVYISDSGTQVRTAAGNIVVTGTGEGSGTNNYGVDIVSKGVVAAAGFGSVTLDGTGGNGTDYNDGVRIDGSSSGATTFLGNEAISGTGQGSGSNNLGVALTGGAGLIVGGSLALNGTGGVQVSGSGSGIVTYFGDLSITGTGQNNSTGLSRYGIQVTSGGGVWQSGPGKLTLNGTAGAGSSGDIGVLIDGSGTQVVSTDTSPLPELLSITGQAGDSTSAGIQLSNGGKISSTGNVSLTGTASSIVEADNSSFVAAVVLTTNSSGGTTLKAPNTVSGFNAGNAGGGDIQLTNTANPLTISSISESGGGSITLTNTGAISVTGKVSADGAGGVNLIGTASGNAIGIDVNGATVQTADGKLTLTGTGGNSGDTNFGIEVHNGATVQATGAGTVTLNGNGGSGGSSSVSNYGVFINTDSATPPQVTTAGGDLSINGNGGKGSDFNIGINFWGGTASVVGGKGNLTLIGNGFGSDHDNYGVAVQAGANVSVVASAAGTQVTGTLKITGTGGNATPAGSSTDDNYGVYITDTPTQVSTGSGDLFITGTGQGSTHDNYGIFLVAGAAVSTEGAGKLTLTGTGSGTNFNYGVFVAGSSTQLSTAGGSLSVTGASYGSAGSNDGIDIALGAHVSARANLSAGLTGTLTLTGTGGLATAAGSSTDGNYGVYIANPGTQVSTAACDLLVTGTSHGVGAGNYGIEVLDSAVVSAAGAGKLTLTGTGGSGTSDDVGVRIDGSGSQVISTAATPGPFTITGQAGDSHSAGVLLSGGGNVTSPGWVGVFGTSSSIQELDSSSFIAAGYLQTYAVGGIVLNGPNAVTAFNASNSSSGDIQLTNSANLLAVPSIGNSGGGNVIVNNNGATSLGKLIDAEGGAAAITVSAAGPLTVGSPGSAACTLTAPGIITLTTTEAATESSIGPAFPPDEDLMIAANAIVESTGANISLISGDSIITQAGSLLKTDVGKVSLKYGNGDNDNDAVLILKGTIIDPAAPTFPNIPTQNSGENVTITLPLSPVNADPGTITDNGTLPPGLSVNSTTGVISGTIGARAEGPYNVTITATSSGVPGTVSFTWNVSDTNPPSFTNPGPQTSLVGAVINLPTVPVDADLHSINATGLPPSLGIDSNTGVISGTIAADTGGTYSVTVSANDGTVSGGISFAWTVNQLPAITSADHTTFTVGTPGSFTVITGNSYPKPSLSRTGNLPSGVTFTDNHNGTATLAGTPAAPGAIYVFTITASNSVGSATQTFTLTVSEPSLIDHVATAPDGLSYSVDGTTYSTTQAFAFTPESTHTLATTSPQTGVAGTQYVFHDWSDGGAQSHQITATTATTYTANFTTQYLLTISASPDGAGTVGPASGYYDAGATVTVSATPNPGYVFVGWTGNVANTNNNPTTVTMNAPQTVAAQFQQTQAPTISSQAQTTFKVGVAGSFTVTATGKPTPALTETDNFPAASGISFHDNGDATATISGTAATGTGGTYTFSITASNGVLPNFTQIFTLIIVAPPVLNDSFGASTILVNGTTSLSFTVTNPNRTTALTGIGFSDTLPAGLVISAPNGLTGSVDGGTITALQGTSVISLSGASLAAGGSGTFSVNVSGTTAGLKNNTTGNITSTEGGTGAPASASINVTKGVAVVTWSQPAPITYGAALGSAQLDATASVPGTYAYTPPAGTVLAAGTQTLSVTFTPSDLSDYTTATAEVSINVNAATLTMTPSAGQSMAYGSVVPVLTYTTSGLVNGDTITGLLGTAATSASPVGAYAFTLGTLAAGANYTLTLSASPPRFAVTPATLTITPATGQSMAYGSVVPVLTYTPSGLVNGDTITGLLGTAATSASPVGAYAFTLGTLTAGANYTLALSASPPTFAVTPATLTITPTAGQSMAYGSVVPVLTYTPSGLVNGDKITGLLGTTATSASPVGAYAFRLGTLTAGADYTLALSASPPTFAVTRATLTITPTTGQSMAYGSVAPVSTYTATGLVNGDKITGLLGTTATSASPVGAYAFTLGTLAAGADYTLALSASPPTFAVTPAPLTITPATGQSMAYGSVVPVLTYTASGLVNGDKVTGLLGTTATSVSPVGTYTFTLGTLAAGADYTLALSASPPTLAVTPATLTITPNAAQSMAYGSVVAVLTYTASGLVNGDKITGLLGTTANSSSPIGSYPFTLGTLAANANYALVLSAQSPTFAVTAGPAGAITTDQPTFAWPAVAGAKHYAVKITQGKTVVLSLTNIAATTYTLKPAYALTPGQSYAWSVTPLNAKGKAIGPSTKLTCQVLPLGAPSAVGPTGSIAMDRPTFTWAAVTDASHTPANRFTLTVTDTATKKVLTITGVTGTSYTLTTAQALTPGHSFTWSVTAVSTDGKARAQSQSAAFTIAPLTAPTGLVFTSATDTFSWQAVTDASHYSLKVVNSSGKVIMTVPDVASATPYYRLTSKQAKAIKHGHYTWYVTAVSTNGKVSLRSTRATFTM